MAQGRTIKAAAFLAAIGLFGVTSQAARLGHAGVSTTGVKGAPTQWQLLCDPAGATNGSTTTSYTAFDSNGNPVALLSEVDPMTGFEVTSVNLQITYPTNSNPGFSPASSLPGNQFTTSFISFTPAANGDPVIVNDNRVSIRWT